MDDDLLTNELIVELYGGLNQSAFARGAVDALHEVCELARAHQDHPRFRHLVENLPAEPGGCLTVDQFLEIMALPNMHCGRHTPIMFNGRDNWQPRNQNALSDLARRLIRYLDQASAA